MPARLCAESSVLARLRLRPFEDSRHMTAMKAKKPIIRSVRRIAERAVPTRRISWLRPQFYRADDTELIAASCQDDQLTVTLVNRGEESVDRTAVYAA